jgi:2-polyprenyl-3-methyl-5-hydroxy-6-metoxy-1,4-benzoquinol methylase
VENLIATNSKVMDIENVFDLVYTSMVLHHIENHKQILADIHSKMVSGGEFFIIDLNPEENKFHSKKSGFKGHAGFNQEVLRTDLLEVGFDVLRSYTFYENIKRVDDKEVPYSLFIMHCVKN